MLKIIAYHDASHIYMLKCNMYTLDCDLHYERFKLLGGRYVLLVSSVVLVHVDQCQLDICILSRIWKPFLEEVFSRTIRLPRL